MARPTRFDKAAKGSLIASEDVHIRLRISALGLQPWSESDQVLDLPKRCIATNC
jgi:hypothetical protein